MRTFFARFAVLAAVVLVLVSLLMVATQAGRDKTQAKAAFERKTRVHLDHSAYFKEPFSSPQAVTEACLKCHANAAADVMHTAHWTWLGDTVHRQTAQGPKDIPVGKKNLINNFCIGVQGNWNSCTACHAGYGWKDAGFDFKDKKNVDCLVCHDGSGQYAKGAAGMPTKTTDLLASAKSVGFPKRQNCGSCHYFGGGGLGVKHGDLDSSLDNPSEDLDVHMGKLNFQCIDCHTTKAHKIAGRSFGVSVSKDGGIGCIQCHSGPQHKDARIEVHTKSLACQTCHIPAYARKVPTKATWDWSKAGDAGRKEDPHGYLKIKGEFTYEQDAKPEYGWFKNEVDRYLLGDPVVVGGVTRLNPPKGGIGDPEAKIWPMKVHRGKQPYDKVHKVLVVPTTSGKGGYWTTFDWERSVGMGAAHTGLSFSGKVGFAETEMVWPLSHMVAPANKALQCLECHANDGRMDFRALGYAGDPMRVGGRAR